MKRDELEAAIRARDTLLFLVARGLHGRVEAVAGARSRKERAARLAELGGFAAELALIASPRAPIVLRPARLDLLPLLEKLVDPADGFVTRVSVTRPGDGVSVVGRWDRSRLESIVLELLSNAVKYGRGRPVEMRVDTRGAFARIVVANPGSWKGPVGPIERFRREERRARVRGCGIGLWLARRLARAHGGHLTFASSRGRTEAIVSLPFDKARGDVASWAVTITPAPRSSRRRRTA